MEYFKEEYAVILYDASLDMATITWDIKFVTDEKYQKATNALLQLILEKNCTRCLCDTTHMGILTLESQRWTNEVLTPMYMQSHLQHMAIVVSKDVFNKVAMTKIVQKANNKQLNTVFFNSHAEAVAWLKQQKVQSVAI